MASKYIQTGIIARLIASYGIHAIILRVSGSVTAIGKTLRVHILMDRGLGFEVPVYWSKETSADKKRKFVIRRVDVKPMAGI